MSKYFFDSSFIIALALDNDSNKSKALELTDLLSEECYIGDNVIEEVVNVVNLKGDSNKAETLYNFMIDNFMNMRYLITIQRQLKYLKSSMEN